MLVLMVLISVKDDGMAKSIKNIEASDVKYVEINLPLYWDGHNKTIEVVDKEMIHKLLQYFSETSFRGTFSERLIGGGYFMSISMNNGEMYKVLHVGNVYIVDIDGQKYKIDYKDAVKIDPVYGEILKANCDSYYPESIEGSLKQLEDNKWAIVVDDQYHKLKTNILKVFDATGEGWNMLHDKDHVVLYFQSQQRLEDYQPKRLIILEHNK